MPLEQPAIRTTRLVAVAAIVVIARAGVKRPRQLVSLEVNLVVARAGVRLMTAQEWPLRTLAVARAEAKPKSLPVFP